ncbi:hypothetical protein PENSPDRAFT_736085 [Peniophora sp. CONT]|nr:hypothetical protein PENSPDRAFT_736085 [Peniophora sp. CONT]
MGLFSRSSKRNSKVVKTAPSDDAAPGAQPLEASQSQQPETPGPNVPGGPGPDSRFKNAPNDNEAMHTSPTAASSLPPSLSPANGSAFASNGNADIAQPQPEPVTQTPRFSQHVQEGTAASEVSGAGDIGNTPPPTANPPLVTQSGNVVDAPPQHPAVTGAGTGIGAPIDRQSPQSSPRASQLHNTSAAAAALPALNGARGSPPGSGVHSPAQRAASPASLNIPNRGRAQNDDRIVYPGDPVTPPADREGVQLSDPGAGPKPILRNSSVRSRRSQRGNGDNAGRAASIASRGRAASIRTTNTTGSTFGNGAVTVQPYVDPDVEDSVAERRALAEQSLTKKDSAKIAKAESRHNRKLSKVIKSEAVSEGKAMDVVLRELSDLQRLQKSAIRDEGVAHSAHTKALAAEHKAELALLAARRAHETALAESRAANEALESSRAHARETTEMLREKAEEVETLRITKGADDRERAVRVRELNGGSSGGGLRGLFGR